MYTPWCSVMSHGVYKDNRAHCLGRYCSWLASVAQGGKRNSGFLVATL